MVQDWRRATQALDALVVVALDRHGALRWANRGFERLVPGEDPATVWRCFSSPSMAPWLGQAHAPGSCLHEGRLTVTGPGSIMVTLSGRVEADAEGLWVVAGHEIGELEALPATLLAINTELQQSQRELARANRLLRQREAELQAAARTDALTGAANRRRLEEALEAAYARLKRYGDEVSLVVFDIDHFKRVNDTHGHAVGDELLRSVGALLMGLARATDLVARFGGEEFVVVMPSTDQAAAQQFAERARMAVAALDRPGVPRVTVSAGVVAWRADEDSVSAFQRGDAALYQAKQAGRDRVMVAAG